jgi:vancomycin resistance protein YoaR
MAFKTPVNTNEKILLTAIIASSLGLFFIAGQIIYYVLIPVPEETLGNALNFHNSDLSAILLNSAQKELILRLDSQKFRITPEVTLKWLEEYYRLFSYKTEYRINQTLVFNYLEKNIAPKIYAPAVNAKFFFSGEKITEVLPAKIGQKLNTDKTVSNILLALSDNSPENITPKEAELVVDKIEPAISLEKVNGLGIDSLLGTGESNFAGSPKGRITNITMGAKKFNGLILAPGEEFSFNKILGEISIGEGFVYELVIKNKKIVPDLGGGICQVSTTLFRAAMAAGLPIIERRAHSLPVHYYNPQGFDSTIYPGVTDLRFTNDTPGYILIESKVEGSKISFEIYGKSDGRKVKIDGPYQYDIQPDGSMKAVVTQIVSPANGEEKKNKFYSIYQSPALFPTVRNPLE